MRLFLTLFLFLTFANLSAQVERWVIYNSDEASISDFEPYQLILLDPDSHPSIKALKERGKTILGYISLGEAEDKRTHFEMAKRAGLLLQENKNWKGEFSVDIRKKEWTKILVEQVIPYILHQGFDGLFLDTLDNAEALEEQDPVKYKGMKEAAINLVQTIRLHYPQIQLMTNRGYFVLPKVANIINMALGEDLMTTYDFKTKKYLMQPETEVAGQIKALKDAQKINPKLQLLSLDYWYPEQTDVIKSLYEEERKKGFIPYVGTIRLDKIIPEPS